MMYQYALASMCIDNDSTASPLNVQFLGYRRYIISLVIGIFGLACLGVKVGLTTATRGEIVGLVLDEDDEVHQVIR